MISIYINTLDSEGAVWHRKCNMTEMKKKKNIMLILIVMEPCNHCGVWSNMTTWQLDLGNHRSHSSARHQSEWAARFTTGNCLYIHWIWGIPWASRALTGSGPEQIISIFLFYVIESDHRQNHGNLHGYSSSFPHQSSGEIQTLWRERSSLENIFVVHLLVSVTGSG